MRTPTLSFRIVNRVLVNKNYRQNAKFFYVRINFPSERLMRFRFCENKSSWKFDNNIFNQYTIFYLYNPIFDRVSLRFSKFVNLLALFEAQSPFSLRGIIPNTILKPSSKKCCGKEKILWLYRGVQIMNVWRYNFFQK